MNSNGGLSSSSSSANTFIKGSLNEKQQYTYNLIKAGQNVYVGGSGGVGKSYLIKKYVEDHDNLKKIQVCATTGVAAVLIEGVTIHSWSGIGILTDEDTPADVILKVRKNKRAVEHWCDTSLLILDEISMLSGRTFKILNAVAKEIRHSDKPFGGLQLVAVGDFAQLPPVNHEVEDFAFEVPDWNEVFCQNHVELTEVIRQSDKVFVDILNVIRRGGQLSAEQMAVLNKCFEDRPPPIPGLKPTMIFPHRIDVERTNIDEFRKLLITTNQRPVLFQAVATISGAGCDKSLNLDPIYNRLPISKSLYIAVGAQVMLTKNLAVESGLANGSRGVVLDIIYGEANTPIGCTVQFIIGKVAICEASWKEQVGKSKIKITQLPLILAYASTSHKSQGSTIDYAKLHAAEAFEYGMVYTMLSRVKSLDGLFLATFDVSKIKCSDLVKKFYNW